MKVRKLGVAGQADQSDRLAFRDPIAGFDADAALGHVAVLGVPAIVVVENDPVAAFFPRYFGVANAAHRDVGHAVPCADYAAGCGCQHFNAGTLHAEIEGGQLSSAFDELLTAWRAQGYELGTLENSFARLDPARTPKCHAAYGTVPGRSGQLAVQGRDAD